MNIDKSTSISIGLGIVLFGGVAYLSQRLARLDITQDYIVRQIEALDMKVSQGMQDRWMGRDMALWASTLKDLNPDIRVPAVVRMEKQ